MNIEKEILNRLHQLQEEGKKHVEVIELLNLIDEIKQNTVLNKDLSDDKFGLSNQLASLLSQHGILTLDDLTKKSPSDLLKIKWFGK